MRWALVGLVLVAVVVVPFVLFERQFNEFVMRLTAGTASPWVTGGIIAALLSLDVFLPVPSSIVSTAAGVVLGLWRGTAVVWLAMTAGCAIGYAVGARASAAARRFVGGDSVARVSALTERYGDWALALCRPIPVLAEASVVFTGLVNAPFGRFIAITAAANLGIALGYAAFGAYSMRIGSFLVAFVGAVVIPGMVMGIWRLTAGKIQPAAVRPPPTAPSRRP